MSLVEITQAMHGVRVALAYATADNFTGAPVYRADARAYLHPDAEAALRRAVALAATQGYCFTLYDAFRPSEAQWKLWEHTPDPEFLADPRRGSPHSRGVAVDLTLCRLDFTPLPMGTPFDSFSPRSHHGRLDIDTESQRNRLLLMGIMTSAGWDFYRHEWWHYQLFQSRTYPLLGNADAPSPML